MGDCPQQGLSRNQILATLPPEEFKRLMSRLELVSFRLNETVFEVGEPARYVYFPQDAVICLVAAMDDGRTVQVSMIGAEGIAGIQAILGAGIYWHTAITPIPGSCLRLELEAFKAEFRVGAALQDRTLSYLSTLLLQASQTAACNRLHHLKQRLARFLLMIHDRVQKDEFPMTHETISHMLGTPRSEVSVAADALRRSGIIAYQRGIVILLSRPELESACCECYQVLRDEFLRVGEGLPTHDLPLLSSSSPRVNRPLIYSYPPPPASDSDPIERGKSPLCPSDPRIMQQEKRLATRVPFQASVTCIKDGRQHTLKGVNISEGGILLMNGKGISLGIKLRLGLELPQVPQPLKLRAEAVRRELPDRVGIAFKFLDSRDKAILHQYIARLVELS
jgi:CRP-like cAMP-binding protein